MKNSTYPAQKTMARIVPALLIIAALALTLCGCTAKSTFTRRGGVDDSNVKVKISAETENDTGAQEEPDAGQNTDISAAAADEEETDWQLNDWYIMTIGTRWGRYLNAQSNGRGIITIEFVLDDAGYENVTLCELYLTDHIQSAQQLVDCAIDYDIEHGDNDGTGSCDTDSKGVATRTYNLGEWSGGLAYAIVEHPDILDGWQEYYDGLGDKEIGEAFCEIRSLLPGALRAGYIDEAAADALAGKIDWESYPIDKYNWWL